MYFRDLLQEGFKNLFNPEEKEQYKDEVFALLQKSYKKIGGLKGSGFRSADDMVKMIPFWKLSFVNDKLTAVVMYKGLTKTTRKLVAIGIDTSNGKSKLIEILKIEFSRSFSEISGPLLKFIERELPSILKQYSVPSKNVGDILNKEITIIDDFYYERIIGNERVRKLLLGKAK